MTQEDKNILLKDLCARLPYGVIADCVGERIKIKYVDPNIGMAYISNYNAATKWESIEVIKPYLRPMSSMTEEEDKEWQYYKNAIVESCDEKLEYKIGALYNWFNSHHFDYRGLIPMGLALESKEGMYKID